MFEDRFVEMSDFILGFKNSKNPFFQILCIQSFPIMARYNSEQFFENGYFDTALKHLASLLKDGLRQLKIPDVSIGNLVWSSLFESLAQLFSPYSPDSIKDYAKNILDLLVEQLDILEVNRSQAMLPAIKSISKKVKKSFPTFFDPAKIQSIVDCLLLNGITWGALEFLELLEGMGIEDMSHIIQLKLLLAISFVLNNGKFYKFKIDGHFKAKYNESIEELKSKLKARRDLIVTEEIICTSLCCLSQFTFPNFFDQIVDFYKLILRVTLSKR